MADKEAIKLWNAIDWALINANDDPMAYTDPERFIENLRQAGYKIVRDD